MLPTVTQFPDRDDSTCLTLQETTNIVDLFKIKLLDPQMCLNVTKLTIVTENLYCDQIIEYSPVLANAVSFDEFVGKFRELEFNGLIQNIDKYECGYTERDANLVTCDSVYVCIIKKWSNKY